MKKNKNIVISIAFLAIILLIGGVFLFSKDKDTPMADAAKFKLEYESLNGSTREKDQKTIRSIEVPENNPFVYQTADELASRIENKESFIVYFGFSDCPWCRSIIPTLVNVANDLKVNTIYYVDVKDIRDTMELDENDRPITTKKGSDGYYKLITKLANVLDDYTLKNSQNKTIKTGTKRIFAPNIVSVVDGKATKMATGISSLQKDAYMELTDEIKNDTYDLLKEVLEEVNENGGVCSPTGC